ncbi:class I adenylate-forming enzyme family protein [Planktotalea sp.]|uniref:class I adenylate-forming enzyme family protein n=1 Tax=Planktotalea sp. TaxID=2029877 RepID=UPI003D6BD0A9
MNIGSWLARRAEQTPAKPALFDGTHCIADYSCFDRAARSVAGWLRGQGVSAGDRIAIFMDNLPEFLIVQYGAWYAGAAVVPINAKLHAREAAWIIEDADAKITYTNGKKLDALRQARAKTELVDVQSDVFLRIKGHLAVDECALCQPDDLAWLFYTSGTTGHPKGVMISHRMLVSVSLCYLSDVDSVSDEDSAIYAAPLSHGAGLYNMVHVLNGARHVFPASRGFEPAEIFELSAHFKSAHMFAAPTMVKRMSETAKALGYNGQGLKSVVYAGGPMYTADIIDAVDQFGDVFVQIYGQGECPMGITSLSRQDISDRSRENWRSRLGSVGRAQSAVQVEIGNADAQILPRGETGEIMVRGDPVMKGYWKNPEASAKTIINGWLMTGDMGFLSEEGYLTMVDRSKDLIISGGTNIYPREVEEILLTHKDVAEVSVVGRANPEWGEDVVAFIVPVQAGHVDKTALDAHCLAHIARFKRPKDYIEIESLPKNNYGKVLKTELRKRVL